MLLFVYVDDGSTPPAPVLCILPTMDVMRFCRTPRIVNRERDDEKSDFDADMDLSTEL